MSLWVKICANTSIEDARLAVDAGADALGFIFAPSPRRVTPEQVAAIVAGVAGPVEKIGVFVDAGLEEIVSTVRACGLTGVQLHSESGPEVAARLRAEFGAGLRILRVVHFGPEAAEQARTYAADGNVDAVLVDSRTATAVGGTGIAFDWAEAGRTVFGRNGSVRLVAAGGLNPENVAEAIATLRPWGVDVASGVEAEPGRKDAGKVRAFVAKARGAATLPASKGQRA
jgi:phosphoribosylanthranilate isomerase